MSGAGPPRGDLSVVPVLTRETQRWDSTSLAHSRLGSHHMAIMTLMHFNITIVAILTPDTTITIISSTTVLTKPSSSLLVVGGEERNMIPL